MLTRSPLTLPRLLYLLAGLAWVFLLWPNPATVFLAACLACLTRPVYCSLRRLSRHHMRRLERRMSSYLLQHPGRAWVFLHRRWLGLRLALLHSFPILGSFALILTSLAVPVSLFMVLVAPQISSGYSRLQDLWQHNFQLPPEWTAWLETFTSHIETVPLLGRLAEEIHSLQDTLSSYLTNFSSDTVLVLVNRGLHLLGGTMSVVWNCFLFLSLSIILIIYAPRIQLVTARIFQLQTVILLRFSLAIRQALRAILLGIVLVALIQGILCAIGFALVSYKNFAFWGLLAALAAPIPVIGTALVWVPLSLGLWFTGNTLAAMFLAAWGVFIVSTADSLLRPLFLKTGIRASYLILILAIFCGITAFGAIGIILGPVLLAFSIQAMEEANLAYPASLRSLAFPAGQRRNGPRP